MYDYPIETVECIWVNIWCMLDWIWSQNCRNTLLLHTVDQLLKSAKNETLFMSNHGLNIDRMERYQIVKANVCFPRLLSKNSQKFEPILRNPNRRLAEGSVASG